MLALRFFLDVIFGDISSILHLHKRFSYIARASNDVLYCVFEFFSRSLSRCDFKAC